MEFHSNVKDLSDHCAENGLEGRERLRLNARPHPCRMWRPPCWKHTPRSLAPSLPATLGCWPPGPSPQPKVGVAGWALREKREGGGSGWRESISSASLYRPVSPSNAAWCRCCLCPLGSEIRSWHFASCFQLLRLNPAVDIYGVLLDQKEIIAIFHIKINQQLSI